MQFTPFILAELMAGAVILAVALFHLGLAWNRVRTAQNFSFFLLGLFVAGEAFAAPLRYLSSTIPDLVLGLKLSQGFIVAYGAALVWFTREYARLPQIRIPVLLSGLGGLVLVLHTWLPNGLHFQSVSGIRSTTLPGGGLGYSLVGQVHPWLYVGNLYGALIIAYIVFACVKLWKSDERRGKAISLTIGIAPFVLFAFPHGVLVNRGLLNAPLFYTFAFFGLVAMMSYDMLVDNARVITLNEEVQANERRWRTLLENVSLFVLVCDRQGKIKYANPFLLETAEYEAKDLFGKPFDVLFPPEEVPELHAGFKEAIAGRVFEHTQTGLVTRSDQSRTVVWSNVLLRGRKDEIVGLVIVGSDLTERVSAEKSRDEAIAQLAALKEQLEAENKYLRLEFEGTLGSTDLIGKSDSMRYVVHKIGQVASTSATVLLEGETGVGKELVARAIHNASPRARMPFVRVNCAALPASLIESELFGHERGSFTGADRARPGRFELAEGGTILLDEIGELALDVQAKLLRVLQEGEYDRIGGTRTRKANVRVIASTNRNLRQDVAAGKFREDLYYRLQVFPISVAPLRERREDIPLLIHHFVQELSRKHGRTIKEVPMKLVNQLSACRWPGNVRELENVLERAIITSAGTVLTLPEETGSWSNGSIADPQPDSLTLDAVERHHIEEILKRTQGQIAGPGGAAEVLGLHPNTLRGRMAKLGVSRPR